VTNQTLLKHSKSAQAKSLLRQYEAVLTKWLNSANQHQWLSFVAKRSFDQKPCLTPFNVLAALLKAPRISHNNGRAPVA
jgi:hypothetical protein